MGASTNIGVYTNVQGTGTNNYAFYADATQGTSTNFAFYGASGKSAFLDNVGIGTDSPSKLLTLNQASGEVGILLEGNGTDVGMLKIPSAGVNHALQFGTISNNEVAFYTNNSEKMRIHQDGNVGINSTNPATRLTVVESSTWLTANFQSSSTTGSGISLTSSELSLEWSIIAQGSTGGADDNNLGFHLTQNGSSSNATGYKAALTSRGVFNVGGAVALGTHQVYNFSCVAAASGTLKSIVNIGSIASLDFHVVIRQDDSNVGVIKGDVCVAGSSNDINTSSSVFVGNVTACTVSYRDPSDTLAFTVTYTGSAPTIHVALNGTSNVELGPSGSCST